MKQIATFDLCPDQRYLAEALVPNGSNKLAVVADHWEGEGTLDMDLEVSYDDGQTWHYGGGCKGAVSNPPQIVFNMTYGTRVTNIRGAFHSEGSVTSTVKVYAEE